MSTAKKAETAGVAFPPPVAFLGGLAIGFGLHHFLPLYIRRQQSGIDALEYLGTGLFVVGFVLAVFALMAFRAAKTSPLPERPSTSLVVRGPFRFSRNPLYVSMSLIHAGVSLIANALWPLLLLGPALIAIRFFVVAREERYLRRRFGAEYEGYCRSVRRWL